MRSVPHDDVMADIFRKDPAYPIALLNDILGDPEAMPVELLIVLRQLAKAFGGVQAIAEKAELNPTQLYRTLSPEGNPSLTTLFAILRALDLQLVVQKRKPPAAALKAASPPKRIRKTPICADAGTPAQLKASR